MRDSTAGRVRRLAEELAEIGLDLRRAPGAGGGDGGRDETVLAEIDRALRPPVHERRVPSSGVIVDPRTDSSEWERVTHLHIARKPVTTQPLDAARRFADGLSTWLLRRSTGEVEWLVFDRPAGSERDLVVLADATGATLVQRHPAGAVRIVGDFGVFRWESVRWRHDPPVASWMDMVTACDPSGDLAVIEALLEFAVHDLGSRGIGATLVYRSGSGSAPHVEARLPPPPPLDVRSALHLGPLGHVLAQIDGATIIGRDGLVEQLGVRLVPSATAEEHVDGRVGDHGGMRHISARRYSYDDPLATVIVVSEDGPVTVLRHGKVLGRSPAAD